MSVSMVIIVHLLIIKMIYELIYYITIRWIWTSIYFTTKQYGVLLIKRSMIDHLACMHTTGKIFVGNGTFISMMLFSAISGILKLISQIITKDVHRVECAKRRMAGKNFNFIHTSIRQARVNMEPTVLNFIAPFFIP